VIPVVIAINMMDVLEKAGDTLDEKILTNIADFTIIVFDINGLKEINDNKGHEEGDNSIINTTSVITTVFGADHTYRIGGDEFIVILENVSQEEIEAYFIKVRKESDKFNESNPDLITPVSFSMGAATYRKELDKDYKAVFKRADEAMYRNKGLYYKNFHDRRKNK
ncbi:MAG: diguanylate cyclase, partial [Bacilli bacterium]|nr:diguanylate cyclase [Bacilli bacterium]